jgi:hypothetical protein
MQFYFSGRKCLSICLCILLSTVTAVAKGPAGCTPCYVNEGDPTQNTWVNSGYVFTDDQCNNAVPGDTACTDTASARLSCVCSGCDYAQIVGSQYSCWGDNMCSMSCTPPETPELTSFGRVALMSLLLVSLGAVVVRTRRARIG